MRPTKYRINLTGSEQTELEQIIRQHTTPQNEAGRARIILSANEEAIPIRKSRSSWGFILVILRDGQSVG
jgi:hypothetical protein